jgi:hypothetical protein
MKYFLKAPDFVAYLAFNCEFPCLLTSYGGMWIDVKFLCGEMLLWKLLCEKRVGIFNFASSCLTVLSLSLNVKHKSFSATSDTGAPFKVLSIFVITVATIKVTLYPGGVYLWSWHDTNGGNADPLETLDRMMPTVTPPSVWVNACNLIPSQCGLLLCWRSVAQPVYATRVTTLSFPTLVCSPCTNPPTCPSL